MEEDGQKGRRHFDANSPVLLHLNAQSQGLEHTSPILRELLVVVRARSLVGRSCLTKFSQHCSCKLEGDLTLALHEKFC